MKLEAVEPRLENRGAASSMLQARWEAATTWRMYLLA